MSAQDREHGGNASLNAAPMPWWVIAIILLGAFLTATGAVLALVHPAMLVSPHDEINRGVRIYAGYLAARNGALAIMLIVLLALGARRSLGSLIVLIALVQVLRCHAGYSRRPVDDRAGCPRLRTVLPGCGGPAFGISLLALRGLG